MKQIFLTLTQPSRALFLACTVLSAAMLPQIANGEEGAARILLKAEAEGGAEAILTVSNTSPGAKLKSSEHIWIDQPVSTDEWTELSITFTSAKDVVLLLRLSASWTKDDTTWVYLDNVQVEGTDIKNPDFEEGHAGRYSPSSWKLMKTSIADGEYIKDDHAQSGKGYVRVPFSCPVTQEITVKAGKSVTLRCFAKLASTSH